MPSATPKKHKKRRKRWLIFLAIVLVLVIAGYLNRERLERIVVTVVISREHVFMPPAQVAAESWWPRFWDKAQFYWDVSKLRVAREKRLDQFNPSLKPLVKEIVRRQAAGEGMSYSMHIYREIRWWLNFTPDTAATRARIADLRRTLSQPNEQKLANMQQPADGSWARGINVWYLKLYYSVDHLKDSGQLKYQPTFLERINSPDKLSAKLDSDLYDNFTKTGIFNREELDETFSAMARLLFGNAKVGYAFDPRLKDALQQYVNHWQNPLTGCWGQWMVDRKGRTWKMDDMAMTFHVISDLHGQVDHKDLVVKRVLQLDGIDFPTGIRFNGHYENHLNWDVVKILRYSWPELDSATRQQARAEISRMLNWCLAKSYQPDGSFKINELDDTLGDAYYYGVSFLVETGYFRKSDRFWTNDDFPGAKAVHDRIEAKLKLTGLGDSGMKDAYNTLNSLSTN
jgi:hypothetical protein